MPCGYYHRRYPRALDIHTPWDIAELCKVSYTAAQARADRMKILYDRKKFLKSPLERQVYDSFLPWIEQYKSRPEWSGGTYI